MVKVGCLENLAVLIIGFLGCSDPKVNLSVSVKKNVGFRFWISSDCWRVSFCFMSLYIEAILWNYIQARLG